jgi:hypothetical protein
VNEPLPRTAAQLQRRLFAVRSRLCWLERTRPDSAAEQLALTIERDVLEWALGDRAEPALLIGAEFGVATGNAEFNAPSNERS